MQRLYEAADRIEAQMLLDFLRELGVQAVVLGDYLSGAAGELPASIFPAVWVVEDHDLVRARHLLEEFHVSMRGAQAAGDWRCSRCGELNEGNFELCWHCGGSR